MEIIQSTTGAYESGDVEVSICANDGQAVEVRLQSTVKAQYGDSISQTVNEVLESFGITQAIVTVNDKGALDSVIRARVQAACCRATGRRFNWENETCGNRANPVAGAYNGACTSGHDHTGVSLKRTSLFVSGANPTHMIQAAFYNEDCLVYDLEDSVPDNNKDAARLLVYNSIKYHRPAGKYVIIRVNGIYSPFFDEDLEAAVRAQPDAIRIPKVEQPDEVRRISRRIEAIGRAAGFETDRIALWCNIESYTGLAYAYEIATADPRVVALALGAEDYTASIKARRTKTGEEILYARNALLIACRRAGVEAMDVVFSDLNDAEGLRADTVFARNLGFDGKTCIHPKQVDIVNACFTPDAKEIRYALRVLEAAEEGKRLNKGAVTLDGSMVDKPMELRAQTTLAQAQAAGILVAQSAGGQSDD